MNSEDNEKMCICFKKYFKKIWYLILQVILRCPIYLLEQKGKEHHTED